MAGSILDGKAASVALTVTNLHSLASSQTWIVGWFSLAYSNLVNKYNDYLYSGTFVTHASNRQAGQIKIYVIASLNDTPLWAASATGTIGTEGVGSFADTFRRDCLVRQLCGAIEVDTAASAPYSFGQTGIAQCFGGQCPTHHGLFVALNTTTTTTAGLAAAGSPQSAIYQTPSFYTYT